MASRASRRLIQWLAAFAVLCLVTSFALVLVLLGPAEPLPYPHPIPDVGEPEATLPPSGPRETAEATVEATPPRSDENADTETTAGDTTSATDFVIAGAAIASAAGGLCSGIAAIMVARRSARQDP